MSTLSQLDGYWLHIQALLGIVVPAWRRAHRDRLPSWRGCTKFTCEQARNECELLYSYMAQLDMDAWCGHPLIQGVKLTNMGSDGSTDGDQFYVTLDIPARATQNASIEFLEQAKVLLRRYPCGAQREWLEADLVEPGVYNAPWYIEGFMLRQFLCMAVCHQTLAQLPPSFYASLPYNSE